MVQNSKQREGTSRLRVKTWRQAEVAARDKVEEDQWPHSPRGEKGSMNEHEKIVTQIYRGQNLYTK